MNHQLPLSELQSWFLTVMITPGGVQSGIVSAVQRFSHTEQNVLVSLPGVNASRRMNIYAEGYVLRLLECLRADFPMLSVIMGEEVFNFFAQAYISTFPSLSPSLFDLGSGFADFLLQSQRHASTHHETSDTDFFKFPIELARLERARTEAIRAPGLESQAVSLLAYAQYDILDSLLGELDVLSLAPCTRLLALSFPMIDVWEAMNREVKIIPAIPTPVPSFVAITRKHYRVNLYALHAWQYQFLVTQNGNVTVLEGAKQAADAVNQSFDSLFAQLMIWLPIAVETGMLFKSKI